MSRTLVVCAAFDAATDAAVETLRERVAAAGHGVRRAHRPHLTLTAARTDDADDLAAVVAEVAARHAPVPLTMRGFGGFPSGVLYVATDESPPLRELQHDVYDTLARKWLPAFGAQSAPGDWVAHCTLATRLPRPSLRALRDAPFDPFPATADALTVIAVSGTGDLARFPLAGPPPEPR
ncbi:MAG: 2'-5' RNA ligase family protein [Jatrophihabitans sp.]|uniref:2'-5' RNA ligase family protein n=1 Tax=Jatrophihabitans sp. TaxID=1932789 RepID=UPI00391409B6